MALEVTKIKNRIRVGVPGAVPKAIIPKRVNSRNETTPHKIPITNPFFASFFAAKKPPVREPKDIEIDATIVAEFVGKT